MVTNSVSPPLCDVTEGQPVFAPKVPGILWKQIFREGVSSFLERWRWDCCLEKSGEVNLDKYGTFKIGIWCFFFYVFSFSIPTSTLEIRRNLQSFLSSNFLVPPSISIFQQLVGFDLIPMLKKHQSTFILQSAESHQWKPRTPFNTRVTGYSSSRRHQQFNLSALTFTSRVFFFFLLPDTNFLKKEKQNLSSK